MDKFNERHKNLTPTAEKNRKPEWSYIYLPWIDSLESFIKFLRKIIQVEKREDTFLKSFNEVCITNPDKLYKNKIINPYSSWIYT